MSTDAGVIAVFYTEPVELTTETEKEGRPIFKDVEHIKILIAGSRDEVNRVATDSDKLKYADQYKKFKDGMREEDQMTGTPLSQWSYLKPSQIKELQMIEIRTVEALAGLSDTAKQRLGMGAHELVSQAKAYIEHAKDSSVVSKYASENQRLREEMEFMQLQIKELADELTSMKSEKKRATREAKETIL